MMSLYRTLCGGGSTSLSLPNRMLIILMGAPCAGKGTQAHLLKTKFQLPIVSAGDLLRNAAENGTGPETEMLRGYLRRGEIVPEHITASLIRARLSELSSKESCILEGYPRNLTQAKLMQSDVLSKEYTSQPTAFTPLLIHLMPPSMEDLIERMKFRWIHSQSGRTYHEKFFPPLKQGADDETGEQLIRREDDREEVLEKRFNIYQKETVPVSAFLAQECGVRVVNIPSLPISKTFQRIEAAVVESKNK